MLPYQVWSETTCLVIRSVVHVALAASGRGVAAVPLVTKLFLSHPCFLVNYMYVPTIGINGAYIYVCTM
jgi:hypothetical protein